MRSVRVLLMMILACLVTAYVFLPDSADASPQCGSQTGHFSDCDPIQGWQSSNCGTAVWCTIGSQCWEWDCVRQSDGSIAPQNIISYSPSWCECDPNRGYKKCC